MKTKGEAIFEIILHKIYLVPIKIGILLSAYGVFAGDLPHWVLYITAALMMLVMSLSSYFTASEIIDYLENQRRQTK